MVDFQSRDSQRGLGGDESGEEEAEPETDAESPAADEVETEEEPETEHHAHDPEHLAVAVVTVSSTRTREDDPAGDAIQGAVETAGHELVSRDVVRDEYDNVQNAVDGLVGRSDVDCVVTTGGTGVTPDDVTVEALEPLLDKTLPGFGELFRRLSYEEVGTRVVGTRATAGVAEGVPVFCLPGSEDAARLGTEEIIVPEAPHLVGLARRD
ncbi:MAG: molybdenum cofactor biosynthesis protein B [Halorientalis sp.]